MRSENTSTLIPSGPVVVVTMRLVIPASKTAV